MGRSRHRPHVRRVALLSVFAACMPVTACTRDDDPGDPTGELGFNAVVVADAEDVRFADSPPAYVAEYRTEREDGEEFERIVVERPWTSRLEVRTKADGEPVTREAAEFGKRSIGVDEPLVLDLPPGIAPADVRVAAVEDAVRLGLLDRREVRRQALTATGGGGARCQVFRSNEGIAAARLEPLVDDDTYVDTCIDEQGLILEEVRVAGGKPVAHKQRTALDVRALTDEERSSVRVAGEPIEVRSGGGSILALTPSSRLPGGMWELPPGEPAGWERVGRYSVVPPQSENFNDPTREGARVAGVADVWTRGVDALVVDQGATLRAVDPFAPLAEDADTIDLGPLGTAEVIVSLRASELRVRRRGGAYVRVFGTLSIAGLEAVARALVEQPSGELVFVD